METKLTVVEQPDHHCGDDLVSLSLQMHMAILVYANNLFNVESSHF